MAEPSEITMPMSIPQMARAMGNAVARERARCQRLLVEQAAALTAAGSADAAEAVLAVASALGGGVVPSPERPAFVPPPSQQVIVMDEAGELPEVRFTSDEQDFHLIQQRLGR